VLKVIVESAALSYAELVAVALCAADEGADFVKTSTGVHKAGGATRYAVEVLADVAHPRGVKVKASGGIRTLDDAHALLDAGADRLGIGRAATLSIVTAAALA
jgi:deoxyribose-phosphate aldolase